MQLIILTPDLNCLKYTKILLTLKYLAKNVVVHVCGVLRFRE